MALASARYVEPEKAAANAEEAGLGKCRTTGQILVPERRQERPLERVSVSMCPLRLRRARVVYVMACERGVGMSSEWVALGPPA
jgi:hypothetical protein